MEEDRVSSVICAVYPVRSSPDFTVLCMNCELWTAIPVNDSVLLCTAAVRPARLWPTDPLDIPGYLGTIRSSTLNLRITTRTYWYAKRTRWHRVILLLYEVYTYIQRVSNESALPRTPPWDVKLLLRSQHSTQKNEHGRDDILGARVKTERGERGGN